MSLTSYFNKQGILRLLGVCLLFFMISWGHMGSSLSRCSTVVLSKPGDHTAGLIYNSWVSPGNPLPSFTALTNYPYGENLRQPLAVTSIVPSSIHLLFSKATNVVCGWNLLVLLGYMSSAIAMFGFMRWLVRNDWVAFFTAYAVTFTPYHLFASWGQIAGLLNVLFILALWQFIELWRKPSKASAIRLGGIIGVGFYTDGYFTLIGSVLLFAFWVSCISYLLVNRSQSKRVALRLKYLAAATATSLVLLIPLAWVNFRYAAKIDSIFGMARGDIWQDAQTYSAQLAMYFKPGGLLYIGFAVVLLAAVGLWFMWRDYKKDRDESANQSLLFFAGWTASVIAVISVWVSLRPKSNLFGVTIFNPSSLIISITPTWRVFGRLYVLVAIGLVVLAGLGLNYLAHTFNSRRYLIILASLLVLVVEFRIFAPSPPTPFFDYQDAPEVYQWLKQNPDIEAIAEYPLNEIPQGAYLGEYYTFQQISGKPILNSLLPNSPNAPLRRSVAGINDPQTLPVLRALGIEVVNVRPEDPSDTSLNLTESILRNPGLQRIFTDTRLGHGLDSFVIKPGPVAAYALVLPSVQYFQVSLKQDGTAEYLVDDDTVLAIVGLPNAPHRESLSVSFNVSADSPRNAAIVQNGRTLWQGKLGEHTQQITLEASPDFPITIRNEKSSDLTHLTISKLQVIR